VRVPPREHNIDTEFLLDLLKIQGSRCALTGVLLSHEKGVRLVSVDRINSKIGHIRGNVQLVCQLANIGKRNRHDQQVRAVVMEIENNAVNLHIRSMSLLSGEGTELGYQI
jgi:hypothetical protein